MRFFDQNCILKWVIFFASFGWLWDILLENLISKKSISTGTFEQLLKSCMPEIIFSKNNLFNHGGPTTTIKKLPTALAHEVWFNFQVHEFNDMLYIVIYTTCTTLSIMVIMVLWQLVPLGIIPGHTYVQLHNAGIRETKECSSYHYSNKFI